MKTKRILFIVAVAVITVNLSFTLSPNVAFKISLEEKTVPAEPANGYEQTRKVCSGQLYDCCKKGSLADICSLSLQTPSESTCKSVTNDYTSDVTCPSF